MNPGLAFWLLCAIFAIGGLIGAVTDAARTIRTACPCANATKVARAAQDRSKRAGQLNRAPE